MRKTEFINILTVGLASLLLIWLTRWEAYQDAMKNWLFIVLVLFAVITIFGYFVPRLLIGREDDFADFEEFEDEKRKK